MHFIDRIGKTMKKLQEIPNTIVNTGLKASLLIYVLMNCETFN